MRDKARLTEELVKQIPEEWRPSVNEARVSWWFNLRNNGGMRLTPIGFQALSHDLKLEQYHYTITDPLKFTQRMLLDLDRKLQTPYYIISEKKIPKKIIFFGSREAMLANLYGDLNRFVESYKPS